jgi:ketosteroid isomerase-like protein
MSQENVGIVRRAAEAFLRGDVRDVSAFLEITDPDFVYDLPPELVPDPEQYHGREGFVRQWEEYMTIWEEGTLGVEVEEYLDAGDQVVVLTHHRGRTKHGMDLELPISYVWTLRGGKVVRGRPYLNRNEALEAAGLSE